MNCIFCCIFHQEQYVNMFFILLESLVIYGNIDTVLLIYTSTPFMNKIKNSHLFYKNIVFEINDTYDTIDKSCKARLDLFNLPISNYDKILYLDTDIIIKNDIQKVFDVCKEDILYVLEEGTIEHENHGKCLFENEEYNDKTAFTSGILLFNNCEKIKELFEKIKEDIKNRPFSFVCCDQPYIVYNAFKYKLYDNKILKSLAVNNNNNIKSDKVIHHFPGGPGVYQHKIENMTLYLSALNDISITNPIDKTIRYINEYLLPIIHKSGELLEGNMFMLHHTTSYTGTYVNKIKNISKLLLNKNINSVMEIGFNAGFSTLLMLFTNHTMNITCFDLGEHKYTLPCYEKIKETFGERINLIIGDSTKTLTNVNDIYDLIHIDGGHTTEVAKSDIINSYRLSRKGTILIMDDYDFNNLHNLWDSYVLKYNLKDLDIKLYYSLHHNIKYVTDSIPKVLFQTNKQMPEQYVLEMLLNNLNPGWNYEFYDDLNVIQFFIDNPIHDLPNIIEIYKSIKSGAHRADLFRYYYLYINGGVFMDSDAMLYVNIDSVVKDYQFLSVDSSAYPGKIFQGILGASPKNKIIKKALYKAYEDVSLLDTNYFYYCEQLYNIIKEDNFGYNLKLYQENYKNNEADILDGNKLIFKHYHKYKIIPKKEPNWNKSELIPKNETNWNNYNKSELNQFDYRILTTYKSPTTLVRVGPRNDGGYIMADGYDYDLFISCGISNDIRFEDAFLDIHNIKCIAFDGTIQFIPPHKNNIEWISKNIGFSNTETTTNLKKYIQSSKKIFLKMDIEGSEFDWLDSMTESELENIKQIVIEIHWPFDIFRMNMLKKLNKTHYIIHLHGNNYCSRDISPHIDSGRSFDGTIPIYNDNLPKINLPEVFEVTYINKKLCNPLEMSEIQFPTKLDSPNNPRATDIHFSIPVINLINKTYTWKKSTITFLDNFKMNEGTYKIIYERTIVANFDNKEHIIYFNEDYTSFNAITDYSTIVNGILI